MMSGKQKLFFLLNRSDNAMRERDI